MTDIYLYADETGNLDYASAGKQGATDYFGFGTAVFKGDHGAQLMEGLKLRARLAGQGISLDSGFHAVNDSHATRDEVYGIIAGQAPRFDATFLLKANALPRVKAQGEMRLYKLAWFLHFKEIARRVSNRNDHLYVIAGTFGTKERKKQAEMAIRDVCNQVDRDVTLCVWSAASSWGLQVADYGLWATHRDLTGKQNHWFDLHVAPHLETNFHPWGKLP